MNSLAAHAKETLFLLMLKRCRISGQSLFCDNSSALEIFLLKQLIGSENVMTSINQISYENFTAHPQGLSQDFEGL